MGSSTGPTRLASSPTFPGRPPASSTLRPTPLSPPLSGPHARAPGIPPEADHPSNTRRLRGAGGFAGLETLPPPITVPAWLCMSTSRDPGLLGVYGFRNRVDRSYDRQAMVESRTVGELSIWDQVPREEKRSIPAGVPTGYPARKVNAAAAGCFFTP